MSRGLKKKNKKIRDRNRFGRKFLKIKRKPIVLNRVNPFDRFAFVRWAYEADAKCEWNKKKHNHVNAKS